MQDSMYVLYSRPPHHIMWHTGMPDQSFLDSQATWAAVKLLHMQVWIDRRLQMRGGEERMSAQAQKRREAVRGMSVR